MLLFYDGSYLANIASAGCEEASELPRTQGKDRQSSSLVRQSGLELLERVWL